LKLLFEESFTITLPIELARDREIIAERVEMKIIVRVVGMRPIVSGDGGRSEDVS
jgi:hypothetical protein